MEEAYEVASTANTFLEICDMVCSQERLCGSNCVSRHQEKGGELHDPTSMDRSGQVESPSFRRYRMPV